MQKNERAPLAPYLPGALRGSARGWHLGGMNAQTPVIPGDTRQRKRAISRKIMAAIDLIAMEGLPKRQAAERVGVHEVTLYKALAKPHVAAVMAEREAQAQVDLSRAKRLATVAAVNVGLDLMHNSPDHRVRARMVELFAGETRQPAVAVQVNNTLPAGYIYARPDMQSAAQPSQVIDGKAESADD